MRSPSGSSTGSGPQTVGERIASHRRKAGLSGQRLAELTGFTQSRVSRLETGAVLPDPAAVRRIGEVLELPTDVVERLVDDADREHNRVQDVRPGRTGVVARQTEVGDLERKSKVIRLFQPTMIPGLLQIDIYAKAVMATAHQLQTAPGREPSEAELIQAVAGRVRRRELLLAGRSRILILLSEAALANRVAGPADMLRQIQFLQEMAARRRFEIRILPFSRPLPGPLVHGFEVADEKWVFIDLFNTSVTTEGRDDARQYIQVFDGLWDAATPDVEPILAEYARRYRSATD